LDADNPLNGVLIACRNTAFAFIAARGLELPILGLSRPALESEADRCHSGIDVRFWQILLQKSLALVFEEEIGGGER
jgi:hypothetical protein